MWPSWWLAEFQGWVAVPPGTQQSTYDSPEYRKAARLRGSVAQCDPVGRSGASDHEPRCLSHGRSVRRAIRVPAISTTVGQAVSAALSGDQQTVDRGASTARGMSPQFRHGGAATSSDRTRVAAVPPSRSDRLHHEPIRIERQLRREHPHRPCVLNTRGRGNVAPAAGEAGGVPPSVEGSGIEARYPGEPGLRAPPAPLPDSSRPACGSLLGSPRPRQIRPAARSRPLSRRRRWCEIRCFRAAASRAA